MSDYDLRSAERRVAAGDVGAMPMLVLALWRGGKFPERRRLVARPLRLLPSRMFLPVAFWQGDLGQRLYWWWGGDPPSYGRPPSSPLGPAHKRHTPGQWIDVPVTPWARDWGRHVVTRRQILTGITHGPSWRCSFPAHAATRMPNAERR